MKKNLVLIFTATLITIGMIAALRQIDVPTKTDKHLSENSISVWNEPLLIGYFHDDQTAILYRTWLYSDFSNVGVGANVKLMTRRAGREDYVPMPDLALERKPAHFGQAASSELLAMVLNRTFQAATIDVKDFLSAVRENQPVIAVMELGHNPKNPKDLTVLVFHKEFLDKYRSSAQVVVSTYVRRSQLERNMPKTETLSRMIEGHRKIPRVEIDGHRQGIDNSLVEFELSQQLL